MLAVEEVYLPDPRTMELGPFIDRVTEIVRLFHTTPVVRIRILGTIAAGEPIEALDGEEEHFAVRAPDSIVRTHHAFHVLRHYLCPSLQSISSDAFEVARVITPLLVGLKLSGKIDIDLDPWLFAGITLLIERMGVAAFCADVDDSADDAPAQVAQAEATAPAVQVRSTADKRAPARKGTHRRSKR